MKAPPGRSSGDWVDHAMCTHGFGGSIEQAEGVATLALHGEADLASRADFDALIAAVVATDEPAVVVDVQLLRYLESACLRSLLHAYAAAEADGRTFVVHGATGIVRRVIEIAGVAELLDDSDEPQ
jgi:anti-anti-sigma factor